MAEVTQEQLFNESVRPHDYDSASYHAHLIEQYKLYVEMADRVSTRRQAANVFFVSINSAILALVGYSNILPNATLVGTLSYAVPTAGMLLCLLWWLIIRSYRDLNTVKFKVIHELEKRLPAKLYSYEWEMAEHGKNPNTYSPSSHIELAIPWLFVILHLVVLAILLG